MAVVTATGPRLSGEAEASPLFSLLLSFKLLPVQTLTKPKRSQRASEPQSVKISHRAQSRAELVRG